MARRKDVKTRLELPDRKTYPSNDSEYDVLMAESFAWRSRRGRLLAKKVKEKLGVPLAFITNAQWKDISEGTDFPLGVRNEINIALQKYWSDRLIDPVSLRKQISDARDKIAQAAEALDALAKDGAIFQGPIEGYERTYAEQRLDLETALEWIVSSEYILADAEKRFSSARGSPGKYGRLLDLVHRLDAVLIERSQRRVDQKKTPIIPGGITPLEFVWMVAQVADKKVSKGRVKNVVAQYLRDKTRTEVRKQDSNDFMPFARTRVYDEAEADSDQD